MSPTIIDSYCVVATAALYRQVEHLEFDSAANWWRDDEFLVSVVAIIARPIGRREGLEVAGLLQVHTPTCCDH